MLLWHSRDEKFQRLVVGRLQILKAHPPLAPTPLQNRDPVAAGPQQRDFRAAGETVDELQSGEGVAVDRKDLSHKSRSRMGKARGVGAGN